VLEKLLKRTPPTPQPAPQVVENPRHFSRECRARLLSPALLAALAELAEVEELPLATLIALLINEGLSHRLQRGRS
jgi:hypothetical protein